MASKEIVRLEDVWASYESGPALEGVNLSIKQNDFLGIIGPNGGGKTTLLRVILGLIKPDRGTVSVMGEAPEKGRRFIGYVAQHSLFDRDFPVSVWEVALMGRLGRAGLIRRYSKEDKAAALHALEEVEMLGLRDRRIGSLSGGQQQRVFVARALAAEPRLLLLDEPMSSVDVTMQAAFYELLEHLREHVAIVLVSHDIGAVSIHVEKIACLNRRLFFHDSTEISAEELETVYQCPVHMIAHVPHEMPLRVLEKHEDK